MKYCKLSIFIFLFTILLGATGCVDEAIYDPNEIGDGTADISATVNFESFVPALQSRTTGDVIHDITDMMVLIYDGNENEEESRLLRSEYFTTANMTNWSINQNGNTDMPGDYKNDGAYDTSKDNPHQAEKSTPRATFNLKGILYGKYHIYVVANMGQLPADAIVSPAVLKNQLLTWNNNPNEVGKNNQMFGYFTMADNTSSQGFNAPLLTIDKPTTNLHAWIKRAASKVTVAFDTKKLKEDIRIYIHKITIHDIPKQCYLGKDNKPTDTLQLWKDGESISFGTGTADTRGLMIYHQVGAGEKNYWETDQAETDHSEKYNALFFYENMQGDYSDRANKEFYNKVMMDSVKFGNTPVRHPDQPDYKDAVPCGTYIEVEGYYDASRNSQRATKGPIKYRFMLGKNTTYNYDAVRNHHYKLTLRFNGYANEADWHIDYVDIKPEIHAPEVYYISYLYNQQMGEGIPIRLAGKPLSLKAEIIENNWAPYDSLSATGVPQKENPGGEFYWNLNAYNDLNKKYNDWDKYRGHCNFVGFLSLRQTSETVISVPSEAQGGDKNGYGPETMTYLQNYYTNNKIWYVGPVDGVAKSEPGYNVSATGTYNVGNDAKYGSYNVYVDEDGSATVMVPMWTRAKSMAPMSGFSGNNPYVNYPRKAIVRFTATFQSKDNEGNDIIETKSKDVTIVQVQRIVNPKAIWKSRSNVDNFEISLTNLLKPTDERFTVFHTIGKWRASVQYGSDWVVLTDQSGNKPTGGYIYGSDNSQIKFNYKPIGVATSDRCGIIKVEYNDYSCVHLILVRQGYDESLQISSSSSTRWSCKNVYAFGRSSDNSETTSATSTAVSNMDWVNTFTTASPLSIGTYFKRGNYQYGFLESNNDTYGWMVSVVGKNLKTVHYTTDTNKENRNVQWGNVWGVTNNNTGWQWAARFDEVINGSGTNTPRYRIPTYDEFNALNNSDVDFGYGVVYGDGATLTQLNLDDAYGFQDPNNTGGTNEMKKKGVRACIVYNNSNANQILFPLSASGYGRRACRTMGLNAAGTKLTFLDADRGTLIYSGVTALLTNNWVSENWYRPINFNLRYNAGAVYWIKQRKAGGHTSDNDASYAWDINYFNYDFGGYDSSSLGGDGSAAASSDACPIKLVAN